MDDVEDGEHSCKPGSLAVPEGRRYDAWGMIRGGRTVVRQGNTIEKKTLEGFLDIELCVEHDEPETDRKGIIGGVTLEERANGGKSGVVGVLGGILGMGASSAAC